jgi:hypothetical protein
MPGLSTEFAHDLAPLKLAALDEIGQTALQKLNARGIEVYTGFRRQDQPEVATIAGQTGVREFCANDTNRRFATEEMAEEWQKKGRLFFQLRDLGRSSLIGYGWTGPERCGELPDCENTFAERLSEEVAGRGLGAPFAVVIASGSVALDVCKVGLETWGSNTAAVRSYLKAGAELVTTRDDQRPTQNPAPHEADGKRRDVRLFMRFPQTFTD